MKTTNYLILAFLFLLASCTGAEKQPTARHVIVIGIDGMSPDGVQKAKTPNMDEMMKNGAWTLKARGVLPSSSSPNWASMIMGAGPEQHGITSNSWREDQHILPTMVSGSGAFFPTIFRIAADQKPELEVGIVYHWTGFNNLFDRSVPDYEITGDTEEETTQLAIEYFREKNPHFLFVHLDHVDGAGHGQGHGSPAYYRAVSKADSLIGLIKQAVEESGMMDDTVIMVSADHGGVGYGHGGETPEELEIPWMAYGKGVRMNHQIEATVNSYDTPATAAMLLGLQKPQAWIGRPVKHAFQGIKGEEVLYSAGDYFRKPVIEPQNDGYAPSGGLFIGEGATMTMRHSNSAGVIRYTTDGSLPTTDSPEYTEAVSIDETTIVNAAIFVDGQKRSRVETAYFRVLKNTGNHGVNYKAYAVDELEMLPDFSQHKPVKSGMSYEISIDDLELYREEHIAMEFEGYIEIDEAGTYMFTTASDDGSKLYINGKQVVDNDGDHGVVLKDGNIELDAGLHEIRVTWFNGGGGKWLGALYQGPGIPQQLIPPNKLYRSK